MSYTGGDLSDLVPEEAIRAADDACREIAEVAGAQVTEIARATAPVSVPFGSRLSPPGALRESYRQVPVHRGSPGPLGERTYVSGVESRDPVALWVEFGVRPHTVKAGPGGWLRFRRWPDGRWVRAKRAEQRGYPGQHIVSRALTSVTETTLREVAAPAVEAWKQRTERAIK